MATELFIPIGFIQDACVRALVQPALLFILLMSFLGHKEWCFVYVCRATIEHRRGAWRPDPVCFHEVDYVTKLGQPFFFVV